MIFWEIFFSLLVGSLSGFLSGLLGVGGGIVVVPGIFFILSTFSNIPQDYWMQVAVATSLVSMVPTSMRSVYERWRLNLIDIRLLTPLLPGILIGVVLGSLLAAHLHSNVLKNILGVVLVILAVYMFWGNKPKIGRLRPPKIVVFLISFFIGFKSGMLGLGGGAIIVPYLIYCGVGIVGATAIAAACTLPVSIVGAISYAILGVEMSPHIPYALGFIYWPSVISVSVASVLLVPVGLRLQSKTPVVLLKRVFACFLFIAGIKVLF